MMMDDMAAPRIGRRLRILVWHVHGSWTTSFVQGGHHYLLPYRQSDGRVDPDARGRCGRNWPPGAIDVAPERLRAAEPELVILQRPEEIDLTEAWTGRRPGVDMPAIYLEHNAPRAHAATTRHPLADQSAIPIVHVTDFNAVMWDTGRAPTTTIGHGIVDPGHLYTGTVDRVAAMINEPDRRWRITGTDLLARLSRYAGIDLFGIGTDGIERRHPGLGDVRGCGDLPSDELHRSVARLRVYVHTARWTSLGLSLIEAMHLGMPVVAFGSTEVPVAIPPEVGVVATDVDDLGRALAELVAEPALAHEVGARAREWSLEKYGLPRFLARWDEEIARCCELDAPVSEWEVATT